MNLLYCHYYLFSRFVLDHHVLSYFSSEQDLRTAKGRIGLDQPGVLITARVPADAPPHSWLIRVGKKSYLLSAPAASVAADWLDALLRAARLAGLWASAAGGGPYLSASRPAPSAPSATPPPSPGGSGSGRGATAPRSPRGLSGAGQSAALLDSAALLLPDALLARVLARLGAIELCRVARVCKRWKDAAEAEPLWRELVKRTWRFYRPNNKNQKWKQFFRDTPVLLPLPSPAGLERARQKLLLPAPQSLSAHVSELSPWAELPKAQTGKWAGSTVLVLEQAAPTPGSREFTLAYHYVCALNHHANLLEVRALIDPSPSSPLLALAEPCAAVLGRLLERCEPLAEPQIAFVLAELLKALQYLHSLGYIHVHVRADRLAVAADGRVKLLAPPETHVSVAVARRVAAVPRTYWTAPETATRQSLEQSADLWAVGCVALELAELVPPYGEQPIERALALVQSHGPPPLRAPHWSVDFRAQLADLLRVAPSQRPTATLGLQYPFVARSCSQAAFAQLLRPKNSSGPSAAAAASAGTRDWLADTRHENEGDADEQMTHF